MASSETLASIIESVVFVSGTAIAAKDIAEKLEVSEKQVLDAAKRLQEKYNEKSGINLLVFNKKLQFSSNPKNADDVAAVQKANGVVAAAGSVNADFIWQHDNKERVYRAHMLTDNINEPVLTAGRMPQNGSECLIDASRFSEDMIGQTIEISDSNDEDTKKNFKYSTYTVVGLADSPLYIHTLRGTTSLGDGTLQGFVLPEEIAGGKQQVAGRKPVVGIRVIKDIDIGDLHLQVVAARHKLQPGQILFLQKRADGIHGVPPVKKRPQIMI